MKQPLAYRMQPATVDDIIGQKHLVGEQGIIRKCLQNGSLFSMIFFGPPGVGKTSLAQVIAKELKRPYRLFNAVTGNKKDLDAIFAEAKLSNGLVLICDEVQRLNKARQDLLLPHLESGLITLIGMTTANPYHAINPAIRSRCHLFKFEALKNEDVEEALFKALKAPQGLNAEYQIEDAAVKRIAAIVNGDIRFALNILEISALSAKDHLITREDVDQYCQFVNNRSFGSDDGYYDLLSALQKSIRGSEVNAALYYLALLEQCDDLESLVRRLLVIAYEDIGLANPPLCARTVNACEAALSVGFPEAAIILATQIIDLALAPKSRTGVDALDNVRACVSEHADDIPPYLQLTPTGKEKYDYHRYDCFHLIEYLPRALKDQEFIKSFNNNQYEKQLKHNYDELKRFKRTADLTKLYRK